MRGNEFLVTATLTCGAVGQWKGCGAVGGGTLTMVNAIRQARESRGWTSARLNYELRRAGAQSGVATASESSLRVMISQWENGHQIPSPAYYCNGTRFMSEEGDRGVGSGRRGLGVGVVGASVTRP